MANVSVEKKAVVGAISLCEYSVDCFQASARRMKQGYLYAGASWKDEKYIQLGNIVERCESALHAPVQELQECIEKLQKMLAFMEEYEHMDL